MKAAMNKLRNRELGRLKSRLALRLKNPRRRKPMSALATLPTDNLALRSPLTSSTFTYLNYLPPSSYPRHSTKRTLQYRQHEWTTSI